MLEQEIKEAIAKSLPSHVGDVLKTRLEQADRDQEKVIGLDKQVIHLMGVIETRDRRISELEQSLQVAGNLTKREEDLKEKERQAEIARLTYELQSEKDKTEFTKGVAMGLVRNTVYRKNVFDSENQSAYQDTSGNWHYPNPIGKSLEETGKEE